MSKSERDTVIEFTKGVMDRIRDRCKKIDSEFKEKYDSCEEEITGRVLKNGERGIYTRMINNFRTKP